MYKNKSYPKIIAICPAAGIGARMKYKYPKQYIKIKNKTLLEHSIHLLVKQIWIRKIIIAINQQDQWYKSLPILNNNKIHIVFGGQSRTDSVRCALKYVKKTNWVLIHDAVRPCLHQSDLNQLLKNLYTPSNGMILASPVNDTIKKVHGNHILHTIQRKNLWRALTPQIFNKKILVHCLNTIYKRGKSITDEATALEECGYVLNLVQGRSDNIKVTYPEDLNFAKFFINCIRRF
ncbi:MAG: 2-C-methyl-D-erythritol 4-phosphate cytidylyltransferase [Wigglesworthia glossinidia]|nr:2-C-methyl-D-erythritol 4-phosphate cytidylyltransferase [Wigglesworthia glossinidia]